MLSTLFAPSGVDFGRSRSCHVICTIHLVSLVFPRFPPPLTLSFYALNLFRSPSPTSGVTILDHQATLDSVGVRLSRALGLQDERTKSGSRSDPGPSWGSYPSFARTNVRSASIRFPPSTFAYLSCLFSSRFCPCAKRK